VHVGEAEARAVAGAHAGLEHPVERFSGDAATVVADGHAQPASPDPRPHDQPQRTVGLAVLDRVLDQGLDEKRRQAHVERIG
jgi:hypothetical protein